MFVLDDDPGAHHFCCILARNIYIYIYIYTYIDIYIYTHTHTYIKPQSNYEKTLYNTN